MKFPAIALILAMLFAVGGTARADEGMWTLDHFPSSTVGAKYGFTPSAAWLKHVRTAALRIAGGCSASFVSKSGLVMTNHHCVVPCVNSMTTAKKNYLETGYYAKRQSDEVKCPGFEIDQLADITDVTKQMMAATQGKSGTALTEAIRAENAKLQQSCGTSDAVRCDIVPLYHGGVYDVYRYHRYRDVRLVFAPEFGVAQFGGDPDNFNFPRFDYDVSFLRVYENGKPASTPEYLHWSPNGSKAGELVFVAGNPGSTERLLTVSQLEYLRDSALPKALARLAEMRGVLEQYQAESPQHLRWTKEELFYGENSYKVVKGELEALDDPAFFGSLVRKEHALRAHAGPASADLWKKMAALQTLKANLADAYTYKTGNFIRSSYFDIARTLVRLPVEKAKPNAQRLPEFSDAALVTLPAELFDPSPIHPSAEEVNLRLALDRVRRVYGPDDPFVQAVLQGRSPAAQAHYLVSNTKLGDVAVRKALYNGGEAAVKASKDPFILLAERIDAQSRATRKQWENEVANPERQLSEQIAKARFAVTGTSVYPDATFTLRLSYGTVKGFTDSHGVIPPYTTIGGLFKRATGADPYVLPPSWLAAKSQLNMNTPMNLSTTNDIIGGNSGSPLIDKNGDIVGLIFDGNIHSLGGAFGYDPRLNRSVSVDSRAIIAGLKHVYHANRIVDEILH